MADSKFNKMYQFMVTVRNLEWPPVVDNELTCVLCKKILINACQLICGCRLCSLCVDDLFTNTLALRKFCPGNFRYCNEEIRCSRSEIQEDFRANKLVSMMNVTCPVISCQFKCQMIDMEEHYELCGKTQCPFTEWGCQIDLINDVDHMKSASVNHGKMVIDNFNILRNEMSILRRASEEKSAQIENLKNMMYIYEEQLKILMEEMKLLKNSCLKSFNSSLSTSSISNFVWTIDQVTSLRESGARVWSEFFFSNSGFKLRLLLYPNGYSTGVYKKGLTIYLYVYTYNDLKWPLKAEVIVTIVNRKHLMFRSVNQKVNCVIQRPVFFNWTEPFDFMYEDLVQESVLVKDCFDVHCNINEQ